MNPYEHGLIPKNIYSQKTIVKGIITAIMDAKLTNRRLNLMVEPTRAFKKYDQIEIIATDETAELGEEINNIAYIGFVEVTKGGLIRVGDVFFINEEKKGTVLGFDATHTPNHYNLILNVSALSTGGELGIKLNEEVKFVYE